MKRFAPSTIAASTVLVAALLGGVAGGALVLGDDGSEAAAPRPVQMGLKVAEEATTAPSFAPSATPEAEATLEAQAPAEAPRTAQEEPVATTPTETAREAADRAEKAAKRAEDAAAKVTPTPSPSPVAVKPAPTPEPPAAPPTVKTCSGDRPSHDHVCDTKTGEWTYQAPVLAPEFNDFGHATPCKGAGSKPARGYRCLQHVDGTNEWAPPAGS